MMRRVNVYTICLLLALSILFVIDIGTRYFDTASYLTSIKSGRNIKIVIRVEDGENSYTQQIPIIMNYGSIDTNNIQTNENHSNGRHDKLTIIENGTDNFAKIKKILEKARTDISNELANYSYNFSQSDVNGLEDLVMESGGQPLRSLIITSWRSGSTFLGDLVNAVPSTYYHYEPLLMYGIKQIREEVDASEAQSIVRRMFKCNFYGLEDYFEFESKDMSLFSHSTRLFDYCKDENKNDLCFNAEFISRLCKLFPFQSMKLVRLRLRLVEKILEDKE